MILLAAGATAASAGLGGALIEWTLRAVGAAYALGGVFIVLQARTLLFLTDAENELARAARDLRRSVDAIPGAEEVTDQLDEIGVPDPPPPALMRLRSAWIVLGGVILALGGAALAAWHSLAFPLLLALLVHQAAFILVCGWWARARNDPDLASEPSSQRATVGLVVVLIAIWFVGPGAAAR